MPPLGFFLVSSTIAALLLQLTTPLLTQTWPPMILSVGSIFLAQFLMWIVYYWLIFPHFLSPLRHLPSPQNSSFFMGQFFNTGFSGGRTSASIRRWIDEVPNSGIIRYLDIFNKERIILTSPEALAEVLAQKAYEFTKPTQFVQTLGRILGIGLFLAEGQEHKIQRKNLMPAFAFRHIKDLYPAFWSKSRELVNRLTSASNGASNNSINVNEWASRATLDIIGITGLGQDFGALSNSDNELAHTYKTLFTPSKTARIMQLLGLLLPLWLLRSLPVKRNSMLLNASKLIRSACNDLVQNAKRALDSGKAEKNILSVALESGGFSDDELANQLMTFLLAGHETTASALAWTVCMLCKHPEIQNRLQAEVRSTLTDPREPGSSVSASDIDNLPYLNAVCNESLRLWPPVTMTYRVPTNDTEILHQYIPRNTWILIAPWAINASKALWGEDALEFKPERWLGQGKANAGGADSNYAYSTFLHGPRSCIGQSFARGELACLVAAWAWSFQSQFADEAYEISSSNSITAKPKDLLVQLKASDP